MAAAAAKAAKRRRRRAASRAMQRAGPRPTPTCRRRALPCVLSGASTTVLCNTTALTNGGNNTYICQNIASVNVSALGLAGLTATSTAVPGGGTTSGTASGNIDPLYGQTWSGKITTANAGYIRYIRGRMPLAERGPPAIFHQFKSLLVRVSAQLVHHLIHRLCGSPRE